MTDPYDKYLDDFGARLRSASPSPVPPQRRRGVLAGALATTGALAVTLVLLLTGSPQGTPLDVVAKARAALSPRGEIVYLKIRTEPPGGPDRTTERWTATDPPRWRVVQTLPSDRSGGTVRGGRRIVGRMELSYARGAQSTYLARFDELIVQQGYAEGGPASMPPGPLVANLRALLAEGSVRDAGLAERDGRTVRRLVQRKALPGNEMHTFVYDVDPDSFAPVAAELRFRSPARRLPGGRSAPALRTDIVFTVLAYERIPLNARSAKLLTIPTTPKTEVTRISAAERRRQQREAQKGCHTRSDGTRVCPVRPPRRP